jgi:hypothetical protein
MGKAEKNEDGADGGKVTRHRSPNFPAINLEKAVERAEKLKNRYSRTQVPLEVAQEWWGYKRNSSSGQQIVAALRAYGLLDVEGEGKARKIWINDSAYRIVMNSSDRPELLQKAALAPAIHKELWEKYRGHGIPADEIIKHYLLLDRKQGTFNEDSVGTAVANFRSSLKYAGLLPIAESENKVDEDKERPADQKVKVGDLVQWTSAGTDMFPEPRSVQGLSEDGAFAFVPGTDTGLPVGELTVVGRAMTPVDQKSPPANPFKDVAPLTPPAGVKEDVYDLASGRALLQYPEKLDAESVAELEEWLDLIVRKMRRINSIDWKKTDPKKPKTEK